MSTMILIFKGARGRFVFDHSHVFFKGQLSVQIRNHVSDVKGKLEKHKSEDFELDWILKSSFTNSKHKG